MESGWADWVGLGTIAFAVLIVCLLGMAVALPSSAFSQGASLKSIIDKYHAKNIEEAFYLTRSITQLQGTPTAKKSLCDLAMKALESPSSIKEVFFGVHTSEDLGCAKAVNEKVSRIIFQTIENEATTEELYYATSAAFKLKEHKHISFDGKKFLSVIESLSDLTDKDGSVKNKPKDSKGSMTSTGLAFQTASLIVKGTTIG